MSPLLIITGLCVQLPIQMNDRGIYSCAKQAALALSHKQPEIQPLRLDNNHGNLIYMYTFVFV